MIEPGVFATDAEWKRHERFLTTLRERGRRARTVDAYDSDWRALARWYVDATGQSFPAVFLAALEPFHWLTVTGATPAGPAGPGTCHHSSGSVAGRSCLSAR